MSRNLDRALSTIDELLDQQGQHSPEASYGADLPGACWRCLAGDADTDTELCAPCASYLRGDTDEDPTTPPERPKPGTVEHRPSQEVPPVTPDPESSALVLESLLVIFGAGAGFGSLATWAFMVWREDRRAHDLRRQTEQYARSIVFRRNRRQ